MIESLYLNLSKGFVFLTSGGCVKDVTKLFFFFFFWLFLPTNNVKTITNLLSARMPLASGNETPPTPFRGGRYPMEGR